MCVDEGAGARPETWKGSGIIEDVHVEAVLHVVVAHETEDVVVDIAVEVDLGPSINSAPATRGASSHQAPLSNTNQSPSASGACRRTHCSSDTCDDS